MTRSIGPMWSPETIFSPGPGAASRWSATSQVKGRGLDTEPFSSSAMSLGLGIPRQVALQQSLPPLPQPVPSCNHKDWSVEQFSADRTCLTVGLSQNFTQSTNISVSAQANAQPSPLNTASDTYRAHSSLRRYPPARHHGHPLRR